MRYIAIFDDDILQYFRRDDEDQLTLVLTDRTNSTRAVRLKPVIRPIFVTKKGESLYLDDGHVDAMLKYEKEQTVKKYIKRIDIDLASDDLEHIGEGTVKAITPEKHIGADCKTCARRYCPHYYPHRAVKEGGCMWYVDNNKNKGSNR